MRNSVLVWLCAGLLVASVVGASEPSHNLVPSASVFGTSVGSGARALGMGGAFIAVADDATAASWNPAGLCVLEKPEASLVVQVGSSFHTDYAPFTYTDVDPANTFSLAQNNVASPFSLTGSNLDFASVTYPFRLGSVKVVPQFNYQRVANLGLDPKIGATAYSGTFNQVSPAQQLSYQGSYSQTGSYSGGLDVYAFSVGVSFNPKVYLGVTLNLWRKGNNGSQTTLLSETDSDLINGGSFLVTQTDVATLNQTFHGTSVNFGVLLKPTEKLRLGGVYKSGFNMDYTLTQTDTVTSNSGPLPGSTNNESGTIEWPRTWGVGIAVLPVDVLTISADYTNTAWSKALFHVNQTGTQPQNGTSVPFSFQGTLLYPSGSNPSQPETSFFNDFQVDSQQFRLGVEYVVKSPRFLSLVALPLRAGYFSDRQLFKDTNPALGTIKYNGFTAGLGLVWSRFTVDFAFVHESGSYHSTDFTNSFDPGDGTTETQSQVGARADQYHANQFFISTTVRF